MIPSAFPTVLPTPHPATSAPSPYPNLAPTNYPTSEQTLLATSETSTTGNSPFSTTITPVILADSSKSSTNEEVSLNNMTFVATLLAIIFLACCASIGAYCLLCGSGKTVETGTVLRPARPSTPPNLSDIWQKTTAGTPQDIESSGLPQDFSPRCSLTGNIPDVDVFGEPPKKTPKAELPDGGHRLSEFSKIPEVCMFGEPPEKFEFGASTDQPPDSISELCRTFETHFNSQSVWVGALNIDNCEERYLELAMSDDGLKRVVDLELPVCDQRRFAKPIEEISVVPKRINSGKWVPIMNYKDIHVDTGTELILLGKELELDRLIINGTCMVTKNGEIRRGTFRLVRMTLPKSKNLTFTDKRRSTMIQKVGDLHQKNPTFGNPLADMGGSTLSLLGSEGDLFFHRAVSPEAC